MIKTTPLIPLRNDCARFLMMRDHFNEDDIDFLPAIADILNAISAIINHEMMGNKGGLPIDFDSLFESIITLSLPDIDIDFTPLREYLDN